MEIKSQLDFESEQTDKVEGVYRLDNADYRKHPAISISSLKDLNEDSTPKRFKHRLETSWEQTDAMLFGEVFHTLILEPDTFEDRFAVMPKVDRRTKAGKIEYQDFMQAIGNRKVIDKPMMERAFTLKDSFNSHAIAPGILKNRMTEISVFWRDPETGLHCKARPDSLLENRSIWDVKTMSDPRKNASHNSFCKDIANLKYHWQAAFYCDGMTQATGQNWETFSFIACEGFAPFDIAIYCLVEEGLNLGREQYRKALKRYDTCLKADEWPGYPQVVTPISLPRWAFTQGEKIDE